jgi:peroxiredoxin
MKNKMIFFALSAITLISCDHVKQDQYTLTAEIKGLAIPTVYLTVPVGDSSRLDSAKVKDGKFQFTGRVDEPSAGWLDLREKGSFRICIENADMQINGNADSLDDIKITGSALQDEYTAFNVGLKDNNARSIQLNKEYQAADSAKDSASLKRLENEYRDLSKQSREYSKAYISTHPKSLVSVCELYGLTYGKDFNELDKLYQGLDPQVKETLAAKKFARQLGILKRTAIGQPFIDFTQKDINGNPVSLSSLKGKCFLLDFWASWCGPCRAENPNVLKAYNHYKDKGLNIIAVSLDEDQGKWREAVAQDNMPWTQVSDLKGWRNQAAREYGVEGIPTNFLVDPNGVIIAKDLRGDELEKKLGEVLK